MWTTGATGDGATAYTQAQCILWLHKTFCGASNEGVNKDIDNELEVTGVATPVAINTGEAYVRGFPYFNTASVDVAIATPASNTRIDRIVLRADWSAQTVRITRIAGTEGAGAPSLVQTDGTTWDIPLAQASITTGGTITVTDGREFLHPNIAVNTDMLDDLAVTLAKMAANSVDSDQYVDASIDLAHMSANSVDSPQYVDGSIDLVHMSANSVDSDQYVDGSIDTVHLSADSVDDTKAGDRVPQLYRRQGGHASDWYVVGNTTYTPGAVRMQVGAVRWTGGAASSGTQVVTFPTAFSAQPIGFAICYATATDIVMSIFGVSTTQLSISWEDVSGGTHTTVDLFWLAIGTE